MYNKDIRFLMITHNVKHFEVARAMGKSDSAFSRLIRDELSSEERTRIIETIKQIAAKKDGSGANEEGEQ